MKNILLLTFSNIKRNKFAVFLSVFLAALMCIIIYLVGGIASNQTASAVSVGLLDYDNSKLSEDFKNYLKMELNYQLLENSTYEKLSEVLIDKDISVIIEIPEGFYDKFSSGGRENIIITPLDDYENTAYVQAYINNYLNSINILSKGASGNQKTFDKLLSDYNSRNIILTTASSATVDTERIKSEAGFINSIGFFLMFVFSISILITFMVIEDRNSGVYSRIQIAPVKPLQYIIGSGIFGLVLCLIQLGLTCTYIQISGIKTGVPMNVIILFMALFSLFTVCFSMAIAVVLNSKNTVIIIIMGFATIGCILGGAYFPIDLAPKTLQNLARVLPQYWFMDALRNIQTNVTANIYPNITILTLFSLLFLLVGAVLYAQNYKNN